MSKLSGQLAGLHYQEYILELTEKTLPCGNDISIWKTLLLLPGRMHRKDHPGNSFPLGVQAPTDRPQWDLIVVSSTNVFHSVHFFPCQRPAPPTPPTISATVAGGYATCNPSICVWKLLRRKAAAAPPPFPPGPHIPQSSLEQVLSQPPVVSWLWGTRRSRSFHWECLLYLEDVPAAMV